MLETENWNDRLARAIWRWRGVWLLLAGLIVLAACQREVVPTPIVVTEIITFEDGEQFVITRVVEPDSSLVTPTPAPTIAVAPSVTTLDVGVTGAIGALDPQQATGAATGKVIENVYAALTRLNPATGELEGELATSWQVTEDGRLWTFTLRDDIFWQQTAELPPALIPGRDVVRPALLDVRSVRPVTADDVVFAIQRACDARQRVPNAFLLFIIDNCRRVYELPEPDDVNLATIGAQALDATTLQVRLNEPAAYFLAITTLPVLRPLPRDRVLDEEASWLDPAQFVSSGPFVYSQLSTAPEIDAVVLQRNPQWPDDLWPLDAEGLPSNVERINLATFDTRANAYAQWADDLLDAADLPVALVDQFLDPPAFPPPVVASAQTYYLGFNMDSPVFGDAEVRRAFSAAIDRTRLLTEVYSRRGVAMRHLTPPGVLYAPPVEQVGLGFSPDLAFVLMSNSAFGSCRALGPIRYLINATDIALQHAEELVAMWVQNLGCVQAQFQIEQVQFGTLLAQTRRDAGALRPDIYDLGWASFYPDPHDWFNTVLHCTNSDNRAGRPCGDVDNLIDIAGTTIDGATRAQIYREVEVRFFGTDGIFPIAPLYASGDYELLQNWVTTFDGSAGIRALSGSNAYDFYQVNQALKDLELSQ